MCDTFLAKPSFTKNGNLIFGKNSDREPDEAQAIEFVQGRKQNSPTLKCTFIDIPQVKETYDCILSRPFQMWGAEMGVNRHGLVIGNEAVFTRAKMQKRNIGLTGMDLLRLALERSKSAPEALQMIISLLSEFGQDACGGYRNKKFFYHNSFLIADPNEAFMLETAGKSWAYKKVKGLASISNGLQIQSDYDDKFIEPGSLIFPFNLKPFPKHFSFAGYFSDFLYTTVGSAKARQSCSLSLLDIQKGEIDIGGAIRILQTHELPDPDFDPKKATTNSLCMHATGLTNPSSTTGSMVAEIRKDLPHTIWLTGTSMPCLSVYIPFFFPAEAMNEIRIPGPSADNSLWWKAEKVHRWVCEDYQSRKNLFWEDWQKVQSEFLAEEADIDLQNHLALQVFSKKCLQRVHDLYEELTDKFLKSKSVYM